MMMEECIDTGVSVRCGLLFLLAYAFLLRLPSEALAVTAGCDSGKASLYIEADSLVLQLKGRKNVPQGSRLTRMCWCSTSPVCCSVPCLAHMWALCRVRVAGDVPSVQLCPHTCGVQAWGSDFPRHFTRAS